MSRARRRRNLAIALTVLLVLGLLGAAVLLRMRAAPEPARLLPECDGVLYANLKPVRTFTNLGSKQTSWAPEYRNFVEQTGFEFERDLDEIAFAMHAPRDAQHENRYSEVIVGRFNSSKIADFLSRMARSRENYRNHEIFLIPYEDRIVRVVVLSVGMIAISNTGDSAQIDHIIDEFRRSAFASAGPRLVAKYYHKVPFGSLAWLITEVEPPTDIGFGGTFNPLPFIRQLFGGGVVVASARYNGNVLLRADDFLHDDSAAKDRAEQMQNLITLYKTTEAQTRPEHPDPDLESTLNSLQVTHRNDQVQLNASIPRGLIERMFEAPVEAEPQPAPQPPRRPSRRHRHQVAKPRS
ncbi:MAG TPA: hypothetical protein VG498_00055 [Terriglobales bacterium]|nr:hypothetical protein [Terriglobales bacterium]